MNIHESIYVSALKGGSYDAFSVIYGKYADQIYSFAIKQTKNKTAAQDIVQETFMQLWKNRESLDCEKNIQALLFTMARHQIIDTFRKQVIQVDFEKYLDYCDKKAGTFSTEEQIYYDEFLVRLQKSKKYLSRRECEIFEMSREKNMPVKEIADVLQLSQQTVKNYITSTLKVFRKVLLNEQA